MKRLELRTLTVVVGLTVFLVPACAPAPAPDRTRFNNPDDAASALMKVLKNNNAEEVKAIFGPNAEDLSSGDPVSDRNDRQAIALAMESSWRWEKAGAERMELIIGDEQWPFPVPLAEVRRGWQFDTDAGKEEVLSRRIGRNELRVIGICRKSVPIQKDTRVSRGTASAPACMRRRWRAPPDARTVSTGGRTAGRCRARWESWSPRRSWKDTTSTKMHRSPYGATAFASSPARALPRKAEPKATSSMARCPEASV